MKKNSAFSLVKILTVVILVFTMLFGTVSVAAASDVPTTVPVLTTRVPDINEDGYDDGYYEDDVDPDMAVSPIASILEELRWRIEDLIYEIIDRISYFLRSRITAPEFDEDYYPAANQATLENNIAAALLCIEFNEIMEEHSCAKENLTLKKTAEVDINIVDIEDNATVQRIANRVIDGYVLDSTSEESYIEGSYLGSLQDVAIYPEALVKADKKLNLENGTVEYEFVLIEEATYYDGIDTVAVIGNEEDAIYHDYVADTLYIDQFYSDVPGIYISGASVNYPGATIKATVDAKGRLLTLDIDMPVEGSGQFILGFSKIDVALEGYRNEGFVFTYEN